jgi:hypothetical protein
MGKFLAWTDCKPKRLNGLNIFPKTASKRLLYQLKLIPIALNVSSKVTEYALSIVNKIANRNYPELMQ